MMHTTLVHVHVKADCVDAFIKACLANHLASIKESGNRRFDVLQSPDDASRFILYEAYVREDDATAHKQTAHYLTWRETVADMMAEPRVGEPFSGLYPQA